MRNAGWRSLKVKVQTTLRCVSLKNESNPATERQFKRVLMPISRLSAHCYTADGDVPFPQTLVFTRWHASGLLQTVIFPLPIGDWLLIDRAGSASLRFKLINQDWKCSRQL